MINKYKEQKGFIALFSVIIISFVLILVAVSANFSGFFARFNVLDSESKKRSEALAEACLNYARLAVALDNTFTGTKEITQGNDKCNYEVLGSPTTILSYSEVNYAYTYYRAKVDENDPNISILSFEELPNHP